MVTPIFPTPPMVGKVQMIAYLQVTWKSSFCQKWGLPRGAPGPTGSSVGGLRSSGLIILLKDSQTFLKATLPFSTAVDSEKIDQNQPKKEVHGAKLWLSPFTLTNRNPSVLLLGGKRSQ